MGKARAIHPVGVAASAPYSPAMSTGEYVFVSGQISADSEGNLITDDFVAQARRAFSSLQKVLEAAESSLSDVVFLTTYLVDEGDFDAFNQVYEEFFSEPYPARATVLARLIDEGIKLEMTATAWRDRAAT